MRASFVAAAVAATLLIPSAEAVAQPLETTWVTAVNDGTTLRACPGARCAPAGTLPAGTTVLVFREEHGWYWVDAEQFRKGDGVHSTWVRAEDVRAVVAVPPERKAPKAAPLWKEAEPVPAEADRGAVPVDAPVTSAEACLTCAAPKSVTGSVLLSEDGMGTGGGPGPGDPTFEANLEFGRKKFGRRLIEAQKRADAARMKVNTYVQRCYDKHVRLEDRKTSGGVPSSRSRGTPLNWAVLASSSSPYAWDDAWVTRSTGTVQTMRYCGDLWLAIQKEASDLQFTASDITSRALDANIYPQAIHRLLVTYNLK